MIPYSLNIGVRKKVIVLITLFSACITFAFETSVMPFLNSLGLVRAFVNDTYFSKSMGLIFSIIIPPFVIWYLLYALYSKFFWKYSCFLMLHHVPNLNGKWLGCTYNDKDPNHKRNVTVIIKQDWNNLSVTTQMDDTNKRGKVESFCKCTVAAINIKEGAVILKYAYKNGALGALNYVGYNELQVKKDRIVGQYITTKPTRGMFDIYKNVCK